MTRPTSILEDGSTTRGRSVRRGVFVVTALGAFMASLDLSIVNVAFPALERAFSHDARASLAWVVTGYSIVFGSLLVVAGRSADRNGSRRVFFAGLAVFCVGSALSGAAPSVPLLIAGRVVQGVGAAAVLPSSLGLLLGAYPSERRSQVVAMWGGIGALAVATGPSLGAALITWLGWRAAFYVNLPIGLVAWLLGRRVLDRSRGTRSSARPDYWGVVLLSVSLAALVLAISEGRNWGWSNSRVLAGFAGSLLLGVLFWRRSGRHPEPVLDLRLFHARSFSAANAATLLYAMGFFAMLLGNILFLTSEWHYSILLAGLAVTPGPLVVALVSSWVGRSAVRWGFRSVIMVGSGVFALGLVWFALKVGLEPNYLGVWLPGTLAVGLGIGLTFPVLGAAAVSSLRSESFAVGSAVNQTARQVGGAIGVAVMVVVLGNPSSAQSALTDFHHLWWYVAGTAIAAGAAASTLRRGTAMDHASGQMSLAEVEGRTMAAVLDGELVLVDPDTPEENRVTRVLD
ncbi:MAG: DHA2 family efflux MFS transporter permease subunit [Acidobacteriota bacterium]|nr:DHA2 family efflux MFS transporter permease subunit [Acidobacteriota bacterium]